MRVGTWCLVFESGRYVGLFDRRGYAAVLLYDLLCGVNIASCMPYYPVRPVRSAFVYQLFPDPGALVAWLTRLPD